MVCLALMSGALVVLGRSCGGVPLGRVRGSHLLSEEATALLVQSDIT